MLLCKFLQSEYKNSYHAKDLCIALEAIDYSIETSLLVFQCDKTIPVIRVLVLSIGSNTDAKNRIFDRIEFKYYGNVFDHPKLYKDDNIFMILVILIMQLISLGHP